MINIKEFKPTYISSREKEFSNEPIKFVKQVTRTSSRYDYDRVITYKNRKGEEFTRI